MRNYGAISFTGETLAGRFDEQILAGRKTQTIRYPRKDKRPHVKVGDTTKLYWKMRTKECRLIALVEVTAYEETCLLDMWYDEANAKADGFQDLDEFRIWFWDPKRTGILTWKQVEPIIKESVEAVTTMSRDITKEIIIGGGRRFGKSTTMKIVEYLLEPVYRIKWKHPL